MTVTQFLPRLNFMLGGRSPLSSVPFLVKLAISILVDFFGLGFLVADIALIFTPIVNFLGLSVASALGLGYAFFQGILCWLFWSFPFSLPVIGIESFPAFNAMPTMTILCLWNGFKTRFRY